MNISINQNKNFKIPKNNPNMKDNYFLEGSCMRDLKIKSHDTAHFLNFIYMNKFYIDNNDIDLIFTIIQSIHRYINLYKFLGITKE